MSHAATLPAGTLVDGRYEIVRPIGQGGFAIVYLARHLQLEREVALKVLDLQGNSQHLMVFHERFQREARHASQLDHPNVVKVYDFGKVSQNEQPYMAMELLSGHDLEHELLTQGPLAPERALRLFDDALDALAQAHQKGIVHKDLKPSNLFIAHPGTARERLVIVDFGIARLYDDPEGKLTQTHQYTGTPAYAAPEYIREQHVSPALDVYQMGLILGEALSGTPVVEASSPMAYMLAHCNGQQRLDPRHEGTPIAAVLHKAVDVDPDRRYADAAALRQALVQLDPAVIPDLSRASDLPATTPRRPPSTASLLPQQPAAAPRQRAWSIPLLLVGLASLLLLVLLPAAGVVVYLLLDEDASPTSSSPSAPGSATPPTLSSILPTDDASQSPLMQRFHKLYTAHLAAQFTLPVIDHMVALNELQRRRFSHNERLDPKERLAALAQSAPQDLRLNFDSSYSQVINALAAPPQDEALDAALQGWKDESERMHSVFAEMNDYWRLDEQWRQDGGEQGDELERRMVNQHERYSKKRDILLKTLYAQNITALSQRKDVIKQAKDAEPELIDALLAVQHLHPLLLDDPNSTAARAALEKSSELYRRARDASRRVERPANPGFPLPGIPNHIENLEGYLKAAREHAQHLSSDDIDPDTRRLEMFATASSLQSNFLTLMMNYYHITLEAPRLRAIQQLGR